MGYELKTNTATRIAVGPLVDPTDGKTAETALTVTDLSVQIYKLANDGGAVTRTQFAPTASGGDNDMALVASSTDGVYDLELTASQLNFLGNARVCFYDLDGFLVHYFDIHVVSAAYFNFKYGSTPPSVTLEDDAITAAKFDESTAYPIKSADTGATAIARTGADSDTLETLSDQVDLQATAAALVAVDTVVDAIKAVTDNLPDAGALSSLATAAALATVDGIVDSILEDTATTIPGTITTIDGLVDDLVHALICKQIITEADGAAEFFDTSNSSLGSVAACYTSDGTYTTRKKLKP